MTIQKNLIPEELFNRPAKIIHYLGQNQYCVEQKNEYFGKIESRNDKTNELTLKVMLLADQYKITPDFKRIIVKESDIEISFAVTKINSNNKPVVVYEKLL
jgi:hypothetical protein